MGKVFEWKKEELGLDVVEMDNEHVVLIEKMNNLYEAHEKKESFESLWFLVGDLLDYTKEHFDHEETYMASIEYPELDVHKIIHETLIKQLTEHAESFKQSKELTPQFFNFLKVWLTAHIKGIDMKYSKYAKGNAA